MARHSSTVNFFFGAMLLSLGFLFFIPAAYAGDIPGDADRDGFVNETDYQIWEKNKFTPGAWEEGDFNGDNLVDVSDFNIWNTNRDASSGETSFVPEPGGIVLAMLAIAGLALRRRGRHLR